MWLSLIDEFFLIRATREHDVCVCLGRQGITLVKFKSDIDLFVFKSKRT